MKKPASGRLYQKAEGPLARPFLNVSRLTVGSTRRLYQPALLQLRIGAQGGGLQNLGLAQLTDVTIARNTALGLASQATTALFTAALTLYLVRALGPDSYGVFALVRARFGRM